MSKVSYLARITTPWTPAGPFDESAYRKLLQRYINSDIGVLMAAPGMEGRSLSLEELLRVYQVGVEYCKGRIQVGASGIEENTAAATIERAKVAIEGGVDVINIYGTAGWHGFRPTDAEYLAFFDNVFAEIDYPSAIGILPLLGYVPAPRLVAQVAAKYPQVVATLNSPGTGEMYFLALREILRPDVGIYVEWHGSLEMLGLRPAGLVGFTFLPKTMRRYLDLYEAGKFEEAARVYYDLRRFDHFGEKWGHARAFKMAMKVLQLAGGDGGMREPFLMPDDTEAQKYLDGIVSLDIPEINEMARAAGVAIPRERA